MIGMKVKAKTSFSKVLTKGNDYEVIEDREDQYLIIDDEGQKVGFYKHHFDDPNQIEESFPVIHGFKLVGPGYVPSEGEKYIHEHNQKLFEYMADEHGLILLESELNNIVEIVKEMQCETI